jgi:hypothetical protein
MIRSFVIAVPKRPLLFFVTAMLFGQGCSHAGSSGHLGEEAPPKPISFFIYAPHLWGAEQGESAVRAQFQEFIDHLGSRSKYGVVGVGLNYPYTAFVIGHGPNGFAVDSPRIERYELYVKVAEEMGIPIMVGLNGGPWASQGGAFNAYWKTAQGGRFLARYQDGQVNESIHQSGPLTETELQPYLKFQPYDPQHRLDVLYLTLAPEEEYRRSRLQVLALALREWERIDHMYPGTIRAITTDSEVCDFSFRQKASGDALPIGFEAAMTEPFCREYRISDRTAFFNGREFSYKTTDELHWYEYRAKIHRQFVADTVSAIRRIFPSTPVFTHQLGTLDGNPLDDYRKQDFGSPQQTAFVPEASPGITGYIYGKRDDAFKKLVIQFSQKAGGGDWAMAEFNPGKDWQGSRTELSDYSFETLRFLADHGVTMVGLLAWEANALDAGIKDSGVDDGVKRYLIEGSTRNSGKFDPHDH